MGTDRKFGACSPELPCLMVQDETVKMAMTWDSHSLSLATRSGRGWLFWPKTKRPVQKSVAPGLSHLSPSLPIEHRSSPGSNMTTEHERSKLPRRC